MYFRKYHEKLKNFLRPTRIALAQLNSKELSKIKIYIVFQILLSIIDLVGVGLLGAIGALAIQGIESKRPGNKVTLVLKFFNINNFNFQAQIATLGIIVSTLLISKTIVSAILTRKMMFFLSRKAAELSVATMSKTMDLTVEEINSFTNQDVLYHVSIGSDSLINGLLATFLTLVADIAILLILIIGMFFADPILSIFNLITILVLGIILNRLIHNRAQNIGRTYGSLMIKSNSSVLEQISIFKELAIREKTNFFKSQYKKVKIELSKTTAEMNFIPYIGKYIIESLSVGLILIFCFFEFTTKNAVHAAATLAVFLAATSRITPAILRIQQNIITIRNNLGITLDTIKFLEYLGNGNNFRKLGNKSSPESIISPPSIFVDSLQFQYKKNKDFTLQVANLDLPEGSFVAVVGLSGSGKSTFIDLLLGLLNPTKGTILIGGSSVENAIIDLANRIAYVPQEVTLIEGSIRENVTMGSEINDELGIWAAIEKANLKDFVERLPGKLDYLVQEKGKNLSGGQKQKLGIARALYCKPLLIVMDEATSSLDGISEIYIKELITNGFKNTTRIVIAHRLSTIKEADMVLYFQNGKLIATGKFEEIKRKVKDFEIVAESVGL
jgi:ATP-binding cassette, subfamily B, bacterial PglK